MPGIRHDLMDERDDAFDKLVDDVCVQRRRREFRRLAELRLDHVHVGAQPRFHGAQSAIPELFSGTASHRASACAALKPLSRPTMTSGVRKFSSMKLPRLSAMRCW